MRALQEKMDLMLREALEQQNGESDSSGVDDQEPLSVEKQIEIISKVVGQKSGSFISGTGKAFRKPPLPRGGARDSHLKEQLQDARNEIEELKRTAKDEMAELREKIRILEEMIIRGGSANVQTSEGATSCRL